MDFPLGNSGFLTKAGGQTSVTRAFFIRSLKAPNDSSLLLDHSMVKRLK